MAWGYVAVPLCSLTAILFALEKVRDQWIGVAPVGETAGDMEAA
jgi:hypothetical protein